VLNAASAYPTLRDGGARIGLIGIGSLGAAIGRRLLSCELALVVWNRSSERLASLAVGGATVSTTVADLVRDVDVIIVCLSDVDAIRTVLLGASVDWVGAANRLVLNTSTIGADASESLEADFAAAGVDYLEMPVSGGPEGADGGTLAVYLGDVRSHRVIVEQVVAALAGTVIRCSSNCAAQQLKVLNNLCEAINLWGAAEVVALGRRLGLSLDDLHTGLTSGRGDSRYLRVLLEYLRAQPAKVAVSLAIRAKDLQLAESLAGTLPPLSTLTKELFGEAGKTLGMSADQCEYFVHLIDKPTEPRFTKAIAADLMLA
jgi:3-hydroxyisobutyrate dehydrogenase